MSHWQTLALGPVSDQHVGEFDAVMKQLVELQEKHAATPAEGAAGAGAAVGVAAPAVEAAGAGQAGEMAAAGRVEFGADIVFVAPGKSPAPSQSDTAGSTTGGAPAMAGYMKAGLHAASTTETERRAAEAAAYGADTSPLDVGGGGASGSGGGDGGLGPLPAAEAGASEQLKWLKAQCVEHAGVGGWEDSAQVTNPSDWTSHPINMKLV